MTCPAERPACDRRGVAAVEFALVAPVLVLLMLATVDILTALRTQLRLETAAVQLGQIVSQCTRITDPGDLAAFWQHGQTIMGNLGTVTGAGAQGAIIVTAVRRDGANNEVAWQRRTGSALHQSTVANHPTQSGTNAPADTPATIGGGFVVPSFETLMVTEVSLNRTALVLRGAVVRGALPERLRANTLFLTRAFDAVPLQTPPAAPRTGDPALACA